MMPEQGWKVTPSAVGPLTDHTPHDFMWIPNLDVWACAVCHVMRSSPASTVDLGFLKVARTFVPDEP